VTTSLKLVIKNSLDSRNIASFSSLSYDGNSVINNPFLLYRRSVIMQVVSELGLAQRNESENNSELTSFDSRDGLARGGVSGGVVRNREKVCRESFRRGKLSATRYYSHAVSIAELYERYFFLPERRAFFT